MRVIQTIQVSMLSENLKPMFGSLLAHVIIEFRFVGCSKWNEVQNIFWSLSEPYLQLYVIIFSLAIKYRLENLLQ